MASFIVILWLASFNGIFFGWDRWMGSFDANLWLGSFNGIFWWQWWKWAFENESEPTCHCSSCWLSSIFCWMVSSSWLLLWRASMRVRARSISAAFLRAAAWSRTSHARRMISSLARWVSSTSRRATSRSSRVATSSTSFSVNCSRTNVNVALVIVIINWSVILNRSKTRNLGKEEEGHLILVVGVVFDAAFQLFRLVGQETLETVGCFLRQV